jgi:ABC-type phosphate transport system substrate-binding protein
MRLKRVTVVILAGFLGMSFLLMNVAFVCVAEAGEVVVICNKSVPADSLSKDEIKKIYLGKKTAWDNGQKINFVTLKAKEVHDLFLKEIINKTATQFKTYWKKMVFTGKGTIPKDFDTEANLIAYVAATEGAIGYISSGTKADGVKRIFE